MRIVHVCLRYPPALGGVETYAKEIVERTRNVAAGMDVRVLTSRMRTHGPATALKPDELLDDPPYVQRLHHTITPGVAYPRLQALGYYLGHHQPDIIEAYSFWYQPADAAARYARKYKVPFIFHPVYYENEIRKKAIWQIYKRFYGRASFAAADVTVILSPFEQRLIEKAGFPVKRLELIPPGVDVDGLARPMGNKKIFKPFGKPIIMTASRVSAGKGLEDIINAMPNILKRFPEAHLCLIGEDFDAQENLQKMASFLGIEQHITFIGRLSR